MIQKLGTLLILIAAGCAPVVPHELADARAAYQHAAAGPAAQMTPADLHKAHESLALAEQSFANDPDSQKTKDLSYVAQRRAQLSEALASQEMERRKRAEADQLYQNKQAQIAQRTQGELNLTREQLQREESKLGEEQARLEQERSARDQAEARANAAESQNKELQESLSKLAMVKDEQRGLVLTLSGSVLFVSSAATLLPEAQTRLNQVADALLQTPDRDVVVEGYTDSRGTASYNYDLSQRRADSVRAYLVGRGYPSEKIRAQGMGKERPIADNQSAEGRANNRRVEIVILPKK